MWVAGLRILLQMLPAGLPTPRSNHLKILISADLSVTCYIAPNSGRYRLQVVTTENQGKSFNGLQVDSTHYQP